MKLKCKQNSIYKGFQIVSGVINQSTTKPILKNVKIEVKENKIELFATDLEVGIKYIINNDDYIDCNEDGIVVVPGSNFENILRDWIEEDVEINSLDKCCEISGESSKFLINGEANIELFPEEPTFVEENFIEIDPFLLNSMIKRTIFVIINERIRYTLSGVLFKIEGDNLYLISTDGRRLSKVSTNINNPDGISCNCIIPVKGLVQLEKAISASLKSDHTDEIKSVLKVKVENNSILFKTQDFILFSQLIEGKYPDFNKIVPSSSNISITLNTSKLRSAVKRASVVTTENSNVVKFNFYNNKLILTAEASDVGNSQVVIDIDYSDDQFEIGFNPSFISEALNVVTNDLVEMKFTEHGKAGTLNETFNSNNDKFVHVIMPISLDR